MEQYISLRKKHNLGDAIPLSAMGCEEIKNAFAIDDIRSENATAGSAFFFQFWAHQWTDSVEQNGLFFNRYDFKNNGQGIYPKRNWLSNLVDAKTGKFVMYKGGLPRLQHDGGAGETTPDDHRSNENKILSAFHLFAIKLHNKLIEDYDIDYQEAKRRTVALVSKMTLHEAMKLTGFDEYEFFNDIRTPDMHKAMEFNFALARWGHAQMPDTINGKPLFDRSMSSQDIDLERLFDGSEMARTLNLGVSTAMTEMFHTPDDPSILKLNFGKNNRLGLLNADEMAKVTGFGEVDLTDSFPQFKGIPLWAFVLLEAGFTAPEGQLGPLGARWIADGIAGAELWGFPGQGIWYDFELPKDNPDMDYSLNVIKYANS
jgi:hypothetical protein